jgi:hypothetical protein
METRDKEKQDHQSSLYEINEKIEGLNNRHTETYIKLDQILNILRGTLENPHGVMHRVIDLEKSNAVLETEIRQLEKFKEEIMTNIWKIGGAITAFQLIAWVIGLYITVQTFTKNEKKEPVNPNSTSSWIMPDTPSKVRKVNKKTSRITI